MYRDVSFLQSACECQLAKDEKNILLQSLCVLPGRTIVNLLTFTELKFAGIKPYRSRFLK